MEAYHHLYGNQAAVGAWSSEKDSVVTALVSKEQVQEAEIDELVEKKFGGSLPAFVAAFTRHGKMTEKEIDQVQRMIDRFRKGDGQ